MIELEKVSRSYGRVKAVDNLTLTVPRGEVFGFIGPNGAGKTTTISMIAGLLRPTSGIVRICDVDMADDPVTAKRSIGYIPDRPYLYDKLTAMEFLRFIVDLYEMDPPDFTGTARRWLERFSLLDWADSPISSFSHGMKQRLVMASALIHSPDVVVVDEPMVGLDPFAIRMVKELLRDLAGEGRTVFISTHTLQVAQDLCHRIGVIHKGRLIAVGSVEELKALAQTDQTDLEQVFMALTRP